MGEVGVIVADTGDAASLEAMASRARVVINCVGPYRFHGRAVVAACVAAGAHYVDLTGEPGFIEAVMLEFHEAAAERDVLVVPSCGFDSVPCDVGVLHAEDVFRRRHGGRAPDAVEGFLSVNAEGPVVGHYGTYASAVHGLAGVGETRDVRRRLRARQTRGGELRVRRTGKPPATRSLPWWDARVGSYVALFPGSDASVVRNSQLLRAALRPDEPQPYHAQYFCAGGLSMVGLAAFGGVLSLMAPFSATRSLLLSYPRVFSFGAFSHEGPTDEQLAGTSFTMTFYATAAAPDGDGEPLESVTRVSGPELGYVATPIIAAACALTILVERETLEYRAGVVTPAAAFGRSSLRQRLCDGGVVFEEADAAGGD